MGSVDIVSRSANNICAMVQLDAEQSTASIYHSIYRSSRQQAAGSVLHKASIPLSTSNKHVTFHHTNYAAGFPNQVSPNPIKLEISQPSKHGFNVIRNQSFGD